MMSVDAIILGTALLVALATAPLGVFLVLRRLGLMADAISHAVLPGIVLAFWLTGGSYATLPNLLGAGLVGVLTVALVELLTGSGRVKSDTAIGLVFPALFSLGVLAISLYYDNVHLDLDAVLYGEIAYTPFRDLTLFGANLGPLSVWVMGLLALVNFTFVGLYYKELKLGTFDAGLAASLGFAPVLLHYVLMALVSVTTVGAFEAVGAILVIAFLIVPAATAYLLTRHLERMLLLTVLVGAAACILGYTVAVLVDASISGTIASVLGLLFALALLLSPHGGILTSIGRHRRQRRAFAARLLVTHLAHHGEQGVPDEELREEFGWSARMLTEATSFARRAGWITPHPDGWRTTGTLKQPNL